MLSCCRCSGPGEDPDRSSEPLGSQLVARSTSELTAATATVRSDIVPLGNRVFIAAKYTTGARLRHFSYCQYICIDILANTTSFSSMATKSMQLQVRVTTKQKVAIRRLARRSGQSVSSYVLSRVLPDERVRFGEILRSLQEESEWRFALAELNDFLAGLAPSEFRDAVGEAEIGSLTLLAANYAAAMVEQAASRLGVDPPDWTSDVEPLDEPHFAVPFRSLRAHLLRSAPVAFKRRNIFVDSSVGDRV